MILATPLLFATALLSWLVTPGHCQQEASPIIRLEPDELYDMTSAGLVDALLDVRTLSEWNSDGHIENATLMANLGYTLSDTSKDLMETTLRDLNLYDCRESCRIVVYCRSGARAGVALEIMQASGLFTGQLYNGGGISQWASAGYDLVKTPSVDADCMMPPDDTRRTRRRQQQLYPCDATTNTLMEEEEIEDPTTEPPPTTGGVIDLTMLENKPSPATLLEWQTELDAHRDLWTTQLLDKNATAYQFIYSVSCFCMPAGYPWTVTANVHTTNQHKGNTTNTTTTNSSTAEIAVAGDKVTNATTVDGKDVFGMEFVPTVYSIWGLFDRIQDAIDAEAVSLVVDYDPTWGYPVSISIDYREMMADDEIWITASNLTLVNAQEGTESNSNKTFAMELETLHAARKLWLSQEREAYTFLFRDLTPEPGQQAAEAAAYPWLVTVGQDGMTLVSAVNGDDEPIEDEDLLDDIPTVTQLMALIGSAMSKEPLPDQVEVVYDPVMGYPVSVFIDYNSITRGDEYSVELADLTFVTTVLKSPP